MGAANAIAAYQLYAGRVPPLSMQVLGYMALVSRDHDEHPWFSLGHEALAYHALGRQAPAREADIRAVERAVSPLLRVGAIMADRRAAVRRDGRSTVRYRLLLVHGAHADIDSPPVDNPVEDQSGQASRPTVSGGHVPRNPSARPTESVRTSHGIRGTEEKEEEEERVEENYLDHQGKSPAPGTRTVRDERPEISDDVCPHCEVLIDPDRQCRNRSCPGPGLAAIIPMRRPA